MKTTSLLVAGAVLVLGLSHGVALSQEANRCDVSNAERIVSSARKFE